METERLIIRKFCENDFEDLYRLLSNENVMRYIEQPYSLEQTASFFKNAELRNPPILFAVDEKSGGFIGYVIYHPYNDCSYEIGWILSEEHWHKGYARELLNALMKDAAGKARYLIIECDPKQAVTKHLALSSGFTYMGIKDGCDIYQIELK